ncbi:MAG TPA: acyltransferase family protein, partial [Limnobacter sp.]|nr:acyltransferase family protein [Limnobacter sp.]
IGGYLASQSLFNMLELQRRVPLWPMLKKRYLRLARPFWVAIASAVLLGWVAGKIALHDEVSGLPGFLQLLAHVFLLHDITGMEALSAGVWYVAIDFQLFAVLLFLGWASQKLGRVEIVQPAQALLLLASAMAVASLWWWNRNSGHDEWALYFFGAYGLGVIACWAQRESKTVEGSALLLVVLGLALWIEWRERLLLTGLTALVLMHSHRLESVARLFAQGPVRWLGDISYSVFLIHYGVAVLASSVVIAIGVKGLAGNLLAFLSTWAISIAAGWLLYRWVETR